MRLALQLFFAALAAGAVACASPRRPAADVRLTPSDSLDAPVAQAGRGDTTARGNSAADVAFLQGMIHHHAQALVMAAMIPSRTTRDELRLLGQRITVSQRDEIASMRRWLETRGEYAPNVDTSGAHAHGAHGAMEHEPGGGHHDMPGMLSDADMARLAAASGPAFDRLLLESMIRHHEGALEMVRALFAASGAGQEPELFGIASEVDADQRAEIERMRALLSRL